MQTADVIYTGHMRTFAQCIHSQRWQVLRHYDVAAFYISTVKDADTDSWKILNDLFPDVPVYIDIVNEQPTLPEPPEPVRFEPYARSVPVQAVLRQLWQLQRGWDLRARTIGRASSVVIRMRPDLFFHSFRKPEIELDSVATPYWGRFGGVNDRFAVMGCEAAHDYFSTYSRIGYLLDSGCPLHPESLVKASLGMFSRPIHDTMQTEFSTIRKNGQIRGPEISPFDFCHCSLNR